MTVGLLGLDTNPGLPGQEDVPARLVHWCALDPFGKRKEPDTNRVCHFAVSVVATSGNGKDVRPVILNYHFRATPARQASDSPGALVYQTPSTATTFNAMTRTVRYMLRVSEEFAYKLSRVSRESGLTELQSILVGIELLERLVEAEKHGKGFALVDKGQSTGARSNV